MPWHLANYFLLAARDSNCGTNNGALPGLYDGLCANGQVDIQSAADLFVVVANVVRILMWVAGMLAVVVIIVGGIWYVTAYGDPARLKRAKEILNYAIAGLVMVILAYAVVTFIAGSF